MNVGSRGRRGQALRIFTATISILTVLAVLPLMGLGGAAAQSTATITVNSFAADGSTPLPFSRFTVTGSDGTTYGPLEATPPDGQVTFTVNVADGVTFTIEEDTPPACGEAPDPVEVGPLAAGEEQSVDFTTTFLDNCDLSSISAYRYLCPEGTDLAGTDYATLSSTCLTTVDGATFLFREAADQGEEWTAVTGDFGIPGRAPLVGLSPGDYTVEEQVDDSIYDVPQGEPTVYCLTFTGTPAESSTPDSTEKVETNNGQITLSVNNNRIACDFFTVPATEEPQEEQQTPEPPAEGSDEIAGAGTGTGRIEMHLAACPAGYGGDALFNDCHGNPIEGVNVTAQGPGGYSETGTSAQLDNPGPGVVTFENLAAGDFTLHQDIPGDNNSFRIFCSMADSDETVPYTETQDLGFTVTLTEGMSIVCDWYTIPTDQGQPQPAGNGQVEIHLAACPAGYSAGNYFNDCHNTPIEGVNVSAAGPGGFNDTQTSAQQNNPGPGVVVFSGIPAGDTTFHQDIPGDNNSFFIYCSLADADDTVPHTETQDLGFTLSLTDGMSVICDWYTIPDDQGQPEPPPADNTIEIRKFICPAEFDGNMADFQNTCVDIMTDVTFSLTNLDTGEEMRQKTGTDGKVKFGVGAGDYSATEDVPGEFSTPVVFCAGEGQDFTRFEPGLDGLPFTMASGEYDTCYWFNVPEDLSGTGEPSTVTIHKSKCPDGYSGNNYFDTCHDNGLAGIRFNATGPGGFAKTGTTNNDGHLTFGSLDAGTYNFVETNPTDFVLELYAVQCSIEDGGVVDVDYTDGLGASIDVPEGVSVICDWYNVPEAPGPTGSITVHMFLCSGQEDNDYNWEQDCGNYGAGGGFDLLSAAGEKVVGGTTNNDGILLFYSLSDGPWGLKQTTGNWCHAEADRVDANGKVLVSNGGNTDVFIFNCGKKSISVLPSTGAGPMSGTGNAGLLSIFGGLAGIAILAVARRRARYAGRAA